MRMSEIIVLVTISAKFCVKRPKGALVTYSGASFLLAHNDPVYNPHSTAGYKMLAWAHSARLLAPK